MMTRPLLRTIGFTEAEVNAQCERWLDMPRGWMVFGGKRQLEELPDGKTQLYAIQISPAITPREYEYEDCDRLLVVEVAKAKVLYDRHLAGLTDAQRAAMAANPYR